MNFLNKYLTKKNLVIWGIAQIVSLLFCGLALWLGYSFYYGSYQNQTLNQNVYDSITQKEKYNLVFYKRGCPYCLSAEREVISESKESSIPAVFVDVQSSKGKKLIAKYHVSRPATIVTVRKDEVQRVIYANKVKGKIKPKLGTIKQVFEN